MIVERKVWENEGLLASTSKCLPVGGKGGLRRATSVRSGHALGWTRGGSGGEGTASIGSWYRGGCTALSTGMLGPRIQLAITSQQPQKNSERPWRRPRCRLRKSTGFTNAWMYAICRVTCNLLKFFRDLSNLSQLYTWKKKKRKKKKERKKKETWKTLLYRRRGRKSNSYCAPKSKAHSIPAWIRRRRRSFEKLLCVRSVKKWRVSHEKNETKKFVNKSNKSLRYYLNIFSFENFAPKILLLAADHWIIDCLEKEIKKERERVSSERMKELEIW